MLSVLKVVVSSVTTIMPLEQTEIRPVRFMKGASGFCDVIVVLWTVRS